MSLLSKLTVGQWVAVFCIFVAAILQSMNVAFDKDYIGWFGFLLVGAVIFLADYVYQAFLANHNQPRR